MQYDGLDNQYVGPEWYKIVREVLNVYDDNPIITVNAQGAYPGASLTLSKIDPTNYQKDQLAEAYRATCNYIFALLEDKEQDKKAKISNPLERDLESIPEGEDQLLDMAIGRQEPTKLGIASAMLKSMDDYTLTTATEYRQNFKGWEPIAKDEIKYQKDLIQIIDKDEL